MSRRRVVRGSGDAAGEKTLATADCCCCIFVLNGLAPVGAGCTYKKGGGFVKRVGGYSDTKTHIGSCHADFDGVPADEVAYQGLVFDGSLRACPLHG